MSTHHNDRPWKAMGRSTIKFIAANRALLLTVTIASTLFVVGLSLLTGLKGGIAVGLLAAIIATGLLVYRLWAGPIDIEARQPLFRAVASGLGGFVLVGLLIQAVPYGRDHSNPPVVAEPAWDSPRTRELAVRACFDCHSNEVVYPAYSNVAPFSWAVQTHVEAGRDALNFSEWNRPQDEADEAAETVREGSMPPAYYTVAHSNARLTAAEKQELAAGLAVTLGEGD